MSPTHHDLILILHGDHVFVLMCIAGHSLARSCDQKYEITLLKMSHIQSGLCHHELNS